VNSAVAGDDADGLRAQLAEERARRAAAEQHAAELDAEIGVILRVINCTTAAYMRVAGPLLRERGLIRGEDDPPTEIV
jgi:hypothetical protein